MEFHGDSDINESEEEHESDDNPDESQQSRRKSKQVISTFVKGAKEQRLLTRLTHPKHRDACKLWTKLSTLIHVQYPSPSILNALKMDMDAHPELVGDLQYAMKHAFIAYRPWMVAALSKKWSLMFKSSKAILKKYFGISKKDVLVTTCGVNTKTCMSRNYEPAHYLAVDHNTKKIVLSIRGSQSLGDVITDLDFDPCPFAVGDIEGKAHEGILQSAHSLKDSITEILLETCELHEDYKVVITGHSLGAGVAALLGLMYKDHPIVRQKHGLRVYAFASPCIVSKEFTDNNIGSDFITSIAVNCDWITRLSGESLRKYHLRQDLIMKQPHRVIHECTRQVTERRNSMFMGETRKFLRVLESMESPGAGDELYPLGRILWFISDDKLATDSQEVDLTQIGSDADLLAPDEDRSNVRKYELYDASSCRSIFQELVLNVASVKVHFPGHYLSACGVTV